MKTSNMQTIGTGFETVFKPGYGDMVWSLSYAYINGYKSIHYDGNEKLYEKYKDADSESVIERLLYLNDAMEGDNIEIYFDGKAEKVDVMNRKEPMPVWRFKDRWVGKGNYITVQRLEPEFAKRKYDYEEWKYVQLTAIDIPLHYKIEYLDYTMPIEKVHQLLKHAIHHYGYPGSTSHIAGLVETPYTVFTKDLEQAKKRHPKGRSILINRDIVNIGDY